VGVIEDVEYFDHAIDVAPAAERDALLQAHVHAVDRLADELRAIDEELTVVGLPKRRATAELAQRRLGRRDDLTVDRKRRRRQDAIVRPAGVPKVAAPARAYTLAGTKEVEAAQLHALPDIPDAVERRLVALVSTGQLVERSHVGCDCARVWGQRAGDRLAGVKLCDKRAGGGAGASVCIE